MKKTTSLACLDASTLKLIAVIAMVLDHVGMLLFPHISILRIIGRITLPIMAFFIGEGFRYTRDVKRYMLRLLLFAILTMYPFYLCFGWTQNVLFTLLLGLIAIYLVDNGCNEWVAVISMCAVSLFLMTDWMIFAVILVYGFYKADGNPKYIFLTWLGSAALFYGALTAYGFFDNFAALRLYAFELFTGLAMPLIFMYNGKRGFRAKYFFYLAYPLNFLVIYAILKLL